MTQVVIVEPGFRGHRMEYLRTALSLAEAEGTDVAVALSDPGRSSIEFHQEIESTRTAPVRACVLQERSSLWRRLLDIWRLQHSCPNARWLFLNVDEYLLALFLMPFRRPHGVRGILLRPPRSANFKSALKGWIVRRLERRGYALRPLVSPIHPGSTAAEGVVLDPSGLWETDASDEVAADYRQKILTWKSLGSTPVVGVVGALNFRKSIDELIDAASCSDSFRLLIVGSPDTEFADHLKNRLNLLSDGAVFVDLRRLSEPELDAAIAAVDCLALLYSNRVGSSGLLTRAVRLSTPVVAWGNDTVVGATQSLELGAVARGLEPHELSRAVLVASRISLKASSSDLRDGVRDSWRALLNG